MHEIIVEPLPTPEPNTFSDKKCFRIQRQESLVTETFSRNGRTMDLHIVAKNVAFNILLMSKFDLHISPPTARLIYDFENDSKEEKEVEQLKTPPLEIITHVEKNPNEGVVEAKISVLSSQHERAFFRIKFLMVDPATKRIYVDYSQPIKVIAKRNQIRKMLEKKLQSQVKNENSTVTTPVGVVNLAQLAPKRDRPVQDAILETLHRIEEKQEEQSTVIRQMAKRVSAPVAPATAEPAPAAQPDFEDSFKTFLQAFQKETPGERPNKIRKLLSASEKPQTEALLEFVRLCNVESKLPPLEDNGQCLQCPHKQELDILNNFYDDFFKDPGSPEEIT